MKKIKLSIILAIYFTVSILSLSCSDSSSSQKNEDAKLFVASQDYTIDAMDEASAIKKVTYKMPNVVDQMVDATALVMYPKTAKPEGGWRTVVWTHGTVGGANPCAPSNNPLGTNFKVAAKALLEEGYVIVAPDYEGLGTPGIHPYLHLKSESLSAIYLVKAMKEEFGAEFNSDWMVAGQSQGGQAALGTAEFANSDPSFKGAVAGAPASSLGQIITVVAPQALSAIEMQEDASPTPIPLANRVSVQSYSTLLAYAALAGVGIKAYDENFDYTTLFGGGAKEISKEADGEDGKCLGDLIGLFSADIIKYMEANAGSKLMTYPGLDIEKFKKDKAVLNFLEISQPGTKKVDKPILIIQGAADTNVPAVVTAAMVERMKGLGSPSVELILVENASHTQAIVWKNAELVAFVKEHMPAK